MTTTTTGTTTGTSMDTGESMRAMRTIARGIELSPELKHGIRGTLAFAVLSTVGRIVVPVVLIRRPPPARPLPRRR